MKYNERGKSRIEVSDILNYFKDIDSYYNDCTRYDTLKRMLEDIVAETKEDAERKTGKWIIRHPEQKNIFGGKTIECSECGTRLLVQCVEDEKYCRSCGIKMGGVKMGEGEQE